MPIKAFVGATNCYVSDLEKGEKTLLLYKEEGKLSRIRSRLIYRFSKGSSVYQAELHSGVEADRSGTVTIHIDTITNSQKLTALKKEMIV